MANWAKLLPQLHDRSIRNPVVAQFWPMSAEAAKPVEETLDDIADTSDLVGTDDDYSFVGTPQEPTRQNKTEPEVAETTDETIADEKAKASEESDIV